MVSIDGAFFLKNFCSYHSYQTWSPEILVNWCLVRVTLVVVIWLFATKFWEVAGTYELLVCSEMNAASVVVTCEVVKQFLNFAYLEVVGM